MIEKGKQIASHVLEASRRRHRVRARPLHHRRHRPRDRHHGAGREAARRPQAAGGRAADARRRATSATSPAPSTFPNGCHVAEVEIDPDTGVDRGGDATPASTISAPWSIRCWSRARCTAASCRASARRCMEMTVYDDDGQLLTGSFMDYALPRASDAPSFALEQPSGAGDDQSARRQGLRRGRLRRLADLGDERGRRCAVRVRHPPYRHAGDALPGLARHPGCGRRASGLIARRRDQHDPGHRTSCPQRGRAKPGSSPASASRTWSATTTSSCSRRCSSSSGRTTA